MAAKKAVPMPKMPMPMAGGGAVKGPRKPGKGVAVVIGIGKPVAPKRKGS